METYKKVNEDVLEVTSVRVSQLERAQLEDEKQTAEARMANIQKWLDGVNAKLAVLDG